MRVLVFPHRLEIGGSQTNAIDLATTVRDRHGQEIVFFATPGPVAELLHDRGFALIPAPVPRSCPSPTVMRALAGAVRDVEADLVHAWDWPQCLDAYLGTHLTRGTPVLGSIMSMAVPRFLPQRMTSTFGTVETARDARRLRRGRSELLEPPVAIDLDDPAAVSGAAFREAYGVDPGTVLVVVVSRLVGWLKRDGLVRAIRAVDELAGSRAVRLLIVGEGAIAAELEQLAAEVTMRRGCEVVSLTGPMIDPRPAYAAADVVIGMGGSILRGMAFGKPAVVLGEGGFSEVFDPATSRAFVETGLYGTAGDADRLREQLGRLVDDPDLRTRLGHFAREFVVERYGLDAAAARLDALYRDVVAERHRPRDVLADALAALGKRAASRTVPDQMKHLITQGVLR